MYSKKRKPLQICLDPLMIKQLQNWDQLKTHVLVSFPSSAYKLGLKVVKPAQGLATHRIRKVVSSRMRRAHVLCPCIGHILSAGQTRP